MVISTDDIFVMLGNLHVILKKMGVKRIGLFGAFARGKNTTMDKIDFVVTFVRGYKNWDSFLELAELLEEKMDRRVNLITEKSLGEYDWSLIESEIEYYDVRT